MCVSFALSTACYNNVPDTPASICRFKCNESSNADRASLLAFILLNPIEPFIKIICQQNRIFYNSEKGGLAQMLERSLSMRVVARSIAASSTGWTSEGINLGYCKNDT